MDAVDDLAMMPISRFVSTSSPFYRYCHGVAEICSSYKDVVNAGIWSYQLLVYLDEIRKKFGKEVCDRVRKQQLLVFDPESAGVDVSKQEEGPVSSLSMTMKLIEEVIQEHILGLPDCNSGTNTTVEMNIARTLLMEDIASPDFSRDRNSCNDSLSSDRHRIEESFARCLLLGSSEIRSEFNLIIKNMALSEMVSN